MKLTNEQSMAPVLAYSLFGETDPKCAQIQVKKTGGWGYGLGGDELLAMLQKVFSSDPQQPHKPHVCSPSFGGMGIKGLGRSLVHPCSWDNELQLL